MCERGGGEALRQESCHVWAVGLWPIGYKLGSSAWNLGKGRGPLSVWEVPPGNHVGSDSELQLP